MPELDHVCTVCGAQYHHCNGCKSMGGYIPWRAVACSPECYQVFVAYREYKAGQITEERMREILVDLGFEGKQVRPELQEKFDALLAQGKTKAAVVPVEKTTKALPSLRKGKK